jgi:hypothetical protein
MTKEQLAPWVEKLTRANPKDRTAIVGEMCKENGLKVGDAWRLLKEAGFDSKAKPPVENTPQDNKQQGGATPDNTGAVSGSAGVAQLTDTPTNDETKLDEEKQGGENPPNPPEPEQKPAKKRIKHEKLKGKNLIAGNKTIAFDADGIAELDAADAERLLTIPGYTEFKE